jgi:hypothetical protein
MRRVSVRRKIRIVSQLSLKFRYFGFRDFRELPRTIIVRVTLATIFVSTDTVFALVTVGATSDYPLVFAARNLCLQRLNSRFYSLDALHEPSTSGVFRNINRVKCHGALAAFSLK